MSQKFSIEEYRALAAKSMDEDALMANVMHLCRTYGLHTLHIPPAETVQGWRTPVAGDGKGFPDLLIVGRGGSMYRELKTATGRLEPEQKAWRDWLREAGEDWAIWRPEDWMDGTVKAELGAIR